MKKIIMLALSLSLIVACGKKEEPVKLTTATTKSEMVTKMLSGDKEVEKEVLAIKTKLKEQMEAGNVDAKKELEEWEGKESFSKSLGNLKPEEREKL